MKCIYFLSVIFNCIKSILPFMLIGKITYINIKINYLMLQTKYIQQTVTNADETIENKYYT